MLICFELSMPGNNVWDGRWSGEGGCYVKIQSIRSKKVAERVLAEDCYGYSFGDGWRASVWVRQVGAAEARSLRKKSRGFCGYDWMITAIRSYGEIRTMK